MENKAVLTVDNITKRFLGTVALKNVCMNLYENEILAVMGENGAGKSTLMKILSGIYSREAFDGQIYIDGEECSFSAPVDAEKSGIAMIYQELNLELDLSVAENIMLGMPIKGKFGFIDWEKTNNAAKSVLEELDCHIDVTLSVRHLSPSLQQLVSIARALVRKPKILILDEPTSVLTDTETQKLMDMLRGLKKRGISCIYISHKLDEVFELCDRIVVLRDGIYISEHRKGEGYKSEQIIEEMIGRHIDNMYPTRDRIIGEEILRLEHFCVPHTFAYGKNIIEDAGFKLHKGEILGVTGLVGSGRSELLNSLFGIIPKTNGKIFLKNQEIFINDPQDAKKYGIGLLTEDRKKNGYISNMSIKHNMTLTILKQLTKGILLDQKMEKEIAGKYFDSLRVKAPGLDTKISSLSGGNQQKIILAKWLITDLKILLLDEPTRGIDVGTKSEIYRIMQDLAATGISIVMISSELPELIAMCDRFVVLGKGVVQAELDKTNVSEVAIMQASSNI